MNELKKEARIKKLEVDKKELLRTIENFEERIRRKEKEINAANKLATQRGARMQIMREWMTKTFSTHPPYDEISKYFYLDHPEARGWFDENGVPR